MNVRICKDCKKTFRTPGNEQLCPTCKEKHRKETQKREAEKYKGVYAEQEHKPQKPKISLREVLRIREIYNAIHKDKYRSYGEITQIIDNAKAERCVCCGAFVPEGLMVCPVCEKEGAAR